MGALSWIIVGLLAGALAKLIIPGTQPGGCFMTMVLGIIGAFVGGWIFGLLGGTGVTGVNLWSIIVAAIGAVVVLFVYGLIVGRR